MFPVYLHIMISDSIPGTLMLTRGTPNSFFDPDKIISSLYKSYKNTLTQNKIQRKIGFTKRLQIYENTNAKSCMDSTENKNGTITRGRSIVLKL